MQAAYDEGPDALKQYLQENPTYGYDAVRKAGSEGDVDMFRSILTVQECWKLYYADMTYYICYECMRQDLLDILPKWITELATRYPAKTRKLYGHVIGERPFLGLGQTLRVLRILYSLPVFDWANGIEQSTVLLRRILEADVADVENGHGIMDELLRMNQLRMSSIGLDYPEQFCVSAGAAARYTREKRSLFIRAFEEFSLEVNMHTGMYPPMFHAVFHHKPELALLMCYYGNAELHTQFPVLGNTRNLSVMEYAEMLARDLPVLESRRKVQHMIVVLRWGEAAVALLSKAAKASPEQKNVLQARFLSEIGKMLIG